MRKKTRRTRRHHAHKKMRHENYLVVVRSWMLVVVFALMLGVGAIVGSFLNQWLNASTPTVAGAQVEIR